MEMHRTVVRTNVDDELDEMRRVYDGLDDLLSQASRAIADPLPLDYGRDLNCVYVPQIGFLISIPIDPTTGRPQYEGGVDEDNGEPWRVIYSSDGRVYFKDSRMSQLDEAIGDISVRISGMPAS